MLFPWHRELMVRVDGVGILNKIIWALYGVTFIKIISRAVGVVCASLRWCSAARSPIALATNIVRIGPTVGLPGGFGGCSSGCSWKETNLVGGGTEFWGRRSAERECS
uniref:Uncharacterized protein n=1 Tax=Romanomermis culicivorax TaxID=13658 RepID=A0A915J5Y9_ROMCU